MHAQPAPFNQIIRARTSPTGTFSPHIGVDKFPHHRSKQSQKTFQNTSELSNMACQDLCTLAKCIIRTNLTTNFSEIEDFCQNQDEKLLTTRNKDKKSSQYQHLQRMVHQNISIKMFLQEDKNKSQRRTTLHSKTDGITSKLLHDNQ